MRRVVSMLRLSAEGLSARQIALSLGVARSTVAECVRRAAAAGIGWPLPEDLDETVLERRLYPPSMVRADARPAVDWAAIHAELRRQGVMFKLGSDKESVLKAARNGFHFMPWAKGFDNPDSFVFSGLEKPGQAIGSISFENRRLAGVSRIWGSFDTPDQASGVASALFSALESAGKASGSTATITTKTERDPGLELRTTTFQFPVRKVAVVIVTTGEGTHGEAQVSISESVSL